MSKTVGQKIRQKREDQSLTIEQAASTTRIRARYLEAIEANEFDALPSAAQLRGFVRAYAEFLGLDGEQLLAELPNGETQGSTVQAPAVGDRQNTISFTEFQHDNENSQDADSIFREIGKQLVTRRELLGLALDDVERHTHIRQHYLKVLEAGDLSGLPSPVQGRGMLSNYASFLGLNADELLLRFADGLQTQLQIRRAANPQPNSEPIRERTKPPTFLSRLLTPDTVFGGFIAFSLAAFMLWGIIRIYGHSTNTTPTPSAPSIAEVLLATPTPSETPTPLPATGTPALQAPLLPTNLAPTASLEGGAETDVTGAAVQVYFTIQQRTYLRVLVDGEVQFEGRVLPGSAYPFSAKTQIEVMAGNGAGLQVFFNGVDLGLMGEIGQIVHQVFTVQGIFTPTPTITATASSTPPVPVGTPEIPMELPGTTSP